ncbi:MAG TPA: sugar ABC transporter ATP-binding protein [Candidatus Merdiplasma excrementigallinarum]|uniref:Sugar ABC transporter ATP-binding protein n=1 Tax=Candidatus Merdiplasma excrementigallinarum TaxID=2840864 RepID=A0A9D1NZ87_9FIRM|nr:sugar ABC transporter ATP-binding protein [Candidatus Merdiplasma excrementigallinarum]
MGEVLFETKGIGKTYGTNTVLHDIDMKIHSGEVIGLIGENGAGKSTLMKIISGVDTPSMGEMFYMGKPYTATSIINANKQGIGMVFQEQSLVANLTIAQNIYLGREKKYSKAGLVNWNKMNKDAKTALERVDIKVDPGKKVRDIDMATREMVEIAKVLDVVTEVADGHAIILLDEPTTVLSDDEIQEMYVQIRKMKAAGNGIVFISHHLDEILEITDTIYVFKDGEQTAVFPTKEASLDILYEKMVGRATTGEFYVEAQQTTPSDKVVLEVDDLSLFGVFNHVSFKLHEGEVLGFAGLDGSGAEDVCNCLVGQVAPTEGRILLNGVEKKFGNSYQARKNGILSVPKDRRDEGIIGILSIEDNISISSWNNMKKGGILSGKRIRETAYKWIKEAGIKCTGPKERISQLSGGNAQKVIFARALESGCKVLILNHPTRGVDVGAKQEIYRLVREMTAAGHAIIVIGDTLDECLGLASNVIVFRDGLISGSFECPVYKKPSQQEVVQFMM